MGTENLNNAVSQIWDNALREQTLSTYRGGIKSFKTFLMLKDIINVFIFTSHTVLTHCIIKDSTIKLYLNGVCFKYLKTGLKFPLINMGQSSCVKRQTKHPQYPITTARILSQMCSLLQTGFISTYKDSLLRAAFITCFCGFLTCSEITSSGDDSNKDLTHLSRIMGKPTFCICENKDADRFRSNREADQRLCFRYIVQSLNFLYPKFQASSQFL